MARPKKQEVDYFPHYCDHGKVLFILENHFKNDGYAVFYKLEEILAKTEGHCYNCTNVENWEYLLSKMGTTEEIVLGVLQKLSAMGIIDAPLWTEKRIWMQSFVDSISDVYSRRTVDLPTKPGLLHTDIPLSGISEVINPQSKLKESKVDILSSVKEIISFLNEKSGKNFNHKTKATIAHIKARFAEGWTLEEFKKVITIKCEKWMPDPKMNDYIRPETLFGTKFESYLNEYSQKRPGW